MKLAGKIISAFALVSVLPLILMSVLLYLFVNSSSEQFYVRQSQSALAAFRFHFDDNLLRIEREANELCAEPDFLLNVLDLPKREAELTAMLESRLARNDFQFAVVQMTQPPAIFKAFQDGLGTYVADYEPQIVTGDGNSTSGVVRLSNQYPSSLAVVAGVPIVFRDQLVGKLTVGIMLPRLIEQFPLAAANLSAILVASNGQGLYANSADSLLRSGLAQIAAVQSAESVWQATLADHQYFIQQNDLIDVNGQTVASLKYIFDQNDLGESRSKLLRVFFALAAAAIALALLIGYFVQRALSRPITEMALSAKKIADGDAPRRIHYYADDEIGDLVSGINRLSDDLRDTEVRLRRAEQIAAWQMFARQTAHEIRNFLMPLATTAAQLERWSQTGDIDQKRAVEVSHSIQIEIQRMKNLLAAFSEFAKMPAPALRTIDSSRIVGEIRNSFVEELGQGRLHLESNGDSQELNCDPDQILQVLINLIKNSFEAGATVVELKVHGDQRKLHFEVCDDGCGIDLSKGIDPFTPLFTT
ncbi:MAG: HAMP domain-containing protein, partial [Candidatus Zixiibacteriota bacterium]